MTVCVVKAEQSVTLQTSNNSNYDSNTIHSCIAFTTQIILSYSPDDAKWHLNWLSHFCGVTIRANLNP